MHWRGISFDERFDGWLSNLAQAAEWFPLLGLIGTVAGIMQTFDSFRGKDQVLQAEVIAEYRAGDHGDVQRPADGPD